MLEIKRSALSLAEIVQIQEYRNLINASLLDSLKTPSEATRWVAAEARVSGELAALALSEIYPLNRFARLDSLMIKDNFQGQGIWRQLFSFMESLLSHEEKLRGMEMTFDECSPTAPAIEKILNSLGWPPPALFLIRFHFDAYAFNPPWIHHRFKCPADMQLFSWAHLTPHEREHIEYLGQQGRFLPYLSPLYREETVDLETSVGLRKQGALVGWSITRRPDPSTLLYASLYIDSDLLSTGLGIQLLVESIRHHKTLPIPNALFELSVKEIDPSWWHFVNKRLLPLATHIEKIKKSARLFR